MDLMLGMYSDDDINNNKREFTMKNISWMDYNVICITAPITCPFNVKLKIMEIDFLILTSH